jgi:hypothetical protein
MAITKWAILAQEKPRLGQVRQNEIPPYEWKGCADFYFKKKSGLESRVDARSARASRAAVVLCERYHCRADGVGR